jgi:hypothetical protein
LEIPDDEIALLVELALVPHEIGIPAGCCLIQIKRGLEPCGESDAADAGLHGVNIKPARARRPPERRPAVLSIRITADAADARAFLVRVEGEIRNPKSLNDALGRRLEREIRQHFLNRNKEPNKMGAPKTNFWTRVRDGSQLYRKTELTSVTDTEAVVTIADTRFRIHLFGGTIKPTGGRKFLTIPLVKEARARRVMDYEKQTGRKLFRLPGTGVLVERTDKGADRFLANNSTGVIRGKTGFRKIGIGGGSKLRAVYALKTSVTIRKDPRALPPTPVLLDALNDAAGKWAARLNRKGATP